MISHQKKERERESKARVWDREREKSKLRSLLKVKDVNRKIGLILFLMKSLSLSIRYISKENNNLSPSVIHSFQRIRKKSSLENHFNLLFNKDTEITKGTYQSRYITHFFVRFTIWEGGGGGRGGVEKNFFSPSYLLVSLKSLVWLNSLTAHKLQRWSNKISRLFFKRYIEKMIFLHVHTLALCLSCSFLFFYMDVRCRRYIFISVIVLSMGRKRVKHEHCKQKNALHRWLIKH